MSIVGCSIASSFTPLAEASSSEAKMHQEARSPVEPSVLQQHVDRYNENLLLLTGMRKNATQSELQSRFGVLFHADTHGRAEGWWSNASHANLSLGDCYAAASQAVRRVLETQACDPTDKETGWQSFRAFLRKEVESAMRRLFR